MSDSSGEHPFLTVLLLLQDFHGVLPFWDLMELLADDEWTEAHSLCLVMEQVKKNPHLRTSIGKARCFIRHALNEGRCVHLSIVAIEVTVAVVVVVIVLLVVVIVGTGTRECSGRKDSSTNPSPAHKHNPFAVILVLGNLGALADVMAYVISRPVEVHHFYHQESILIDHEGSSKLLALLSSLSNYDLQCDANEPQLNFLPQWPLLDVHASIPAASHRCVGQVG